MWVSTAQQCLIIQFNLQPVHLKIQNSNSTDSIAVTCTRPSIWFGALEDRNKFWVKWNLESLDKLGLPILRSCVQCFVFSLKWDWTLYKYAPSPTAPILLSLKSVGALQDRFGMFLLGILLELYVDLSSNLGLFNEGICVCTWKGIRSERRTAATAGRSCWQFISALVAAPYTHSSATALCCTQTYLYCNKMLSFSHLGVHVKLLFYPNNYSLSWYGGTYSIVSKTRTTVLRTGWFAVSLGLHCSSYTVIASECPQNKFIYDIHDKKRKQMNWDNIVSISQAGP